MNIDSIMPGDAESFSSWFHEEIQPLLEPVALDVIEAVQNLLVELGPGCEETEGVCRDRWFLFGAERPVKSAERVRTKVMRDCGSKGAKDRPKEDGLRRRVLELADLVRFRVVGSLPCDVRECLQAMFALDPSRMLGRFPLKAGIKDFVRDEQLREPLHGHRAVQFTAIGNPGEPDPVGVEIQLMTALQHAWDRRNHAIYEWLRANPHPEALDLRIAEHAVAEALHVADAAADRNFEQFLDLRRRAP